VVETFLAGGIATSGMTVGSCQQLVVTLSGGGSVTLGGGAMIQTPSTTDSAILSSSAALPAAGYKVTVEVDGINFPMPSTEGVENGATLLAITDTPPQPETESWWASHRIVGFEADMMGGSTQQNTIFINYWSGGYMYTWSGSQWGTGDAAWLPAATHDGASRYTFTVEKSGGQYTLTMLQGGTVIASAQIAVASTTPAATGYLVIGDRLTDSFSGSMRVVSVTMPATTCGPTPGVDLGVTPGSDWNPEPWGPDGSSVWPSADGSRPKATVRPSAAACDCALRGAPGGGEGGALLFLGLLLLQLRLRRRPR